jgi:hypothetical protein
VFSLFERLFGEPARTFDYKWLRAVEPGQATGAHYDFVYMGRGSGRLHTCWVPFGDIPVERGTLAMASGDINIMNVGSYDYDEDDCEDNTDQDAWMAWR